MQYEYFADPPEYVPRELPMLEQSLLYKSIKYQESNAKSSRAIQEILGLLYNKKEIEDKVPSLKNMLLKKHIVDLQSPDYIKENTTNDLADDYILLSIQIFRRFQNYSEFSRIPGASIKEYQWTIKLLKMRRILLSLVKNLMI